MSNVVQGVLNVTGRVFLSLIFLLAAVGNKIPNFEQVADYMASEGVPAPQVLLAGAIVFLIAGSGSLILGLRPRIGAVLLTIFLILATYYFHDFWNIPADKPAEIQQQTIQFFKNLALIGGMLLVMANGVGTWTVDALLAKRRVA